MHEIRLAPELSATSRMVRIWIIGPLLYLLYDLLVPPSDCIARRPAAPSPSLAGAGPLHDLLHDPALVPRQRPRLANRHAIPRPALPLLVVRHEPRAPAQVLVVERVHHQALHLDHHRLLHLGAHHDADLLLPPARLASRCVFGRRRLL